MNESKTSLLTYVCFFLVGPIFLTAASVAVLTLVSLIIQGVGWVLFRQYITPSLIPAAIASLAFVSVLAAWGSRISWVCYLLLFLVLSVLAWNYLPV